MDENKLSEIIQAIDFVNGDPMGAEAYICIATGEVVTYWKDADDPTARPDDVNDESLYLALPTKQELRLGASLAIEFTEEHCRQYTEEVRSYFRKSGAYRNFKALLESANLLDVWYQYEQEASIAAVKNWLYASGISTAT